MHCTSTFLCYTSFPSLPLFYPANDSPIPAAERNLSRTVNRPTSIRSPTASPFQTLTCAASTPSSSSYLSSFPSSPPPPPHGKPSFPTPPVAKSSAPTTPSPSSGSLQIPASSKHYPLSTSQRKPSLPPSNGSSGPPTIPPTTNKPFTPCSSTAPRANFPQGTLRGKSRRTPQERLEGRRNMRGC